MLEYLHNALLGLLIMQWGLSGCKVVINYGTGDWIGMWHSMAWMLIFALIFQLLRDGEIT